MLAALAASGFTPGSSSRNIAEELRQPPPAKSSATTAAESSSTVGAPSGSVSTAAGRRRSLRLSAKNSGTDGAAETDPIAPTDVGESPAPDPSTSQPSAAQALTLASMTAEPAPSDTVVESELQAEFTDDEVDAEVFDDEVDPDNSISEKTVTLSILEGMREFPFENFINTMLNAILPDGSKVEAQTPDGTRVATPNSSKDVPPMANPRHSLSTRASYAAALKAKPADWHLEFSMDDHILPLDLTIYGAIHQHEMRKKSGALPPSLIWQGVYTIKFRKVSGPLPSSESKQWNFFTLTAHVDGTSVL